MGDVKFYFLVTGRTTNNGFGGFADKLAVEIINKLAAGKGPGTARFIHFDCWNNKVQVFDFTPTKAGASRFPKWIDIGKFEPPADEDKAEDPRTFVDINPHSATLDEGGENGIAVTNQLFITNVYHSVRGAPPGSVVMIMFLSHGFADGPVLINTGISPNGAPLVQTLAVDTDTGARLVAKPGSTFPGDLPQRWEKDGDGRVDADFADNMGEDPSKSGVALAADGTTKLKDGGKDALKQFKAAFNTIVVPGLGFAARVGVLGCNVQEIVYARPGGRLRLKSTVLEVLDEILFRSVVPRIKGLKDAGTRLGPKILAGSIDDSQDISFDLAGQFQTETRDKDHFDVPDTTRLRILHFNQDQIFFGNPAPTSTSMQTTWGAVMKFVARQNLHTYQFVAAKTLSVQVLSTPAGTSGEIDEKKQPDKMIACGDIGRCTMITSIYDKFLGLPKSQDGYSLFDSTSVGNLEQHAKL
jgi:hypothetical protein